MSYLCPFCNSLHSAIKGEVYCSVFNQREDAQSIKSNAFYFKSKKIKSGKHIARMTIKTVFNGYQNFKIDKNNKTVNKDNYLIINQGQTWNSEIDSENEVIALTIAFHPVLIKQVMYSLINSSEKLLSTPFYGHLEGFNFFENTYESDTMIKKLFTKFKKGIDYNSNDTLFFKELEFDLLKLIFQKHYKVLELATLIPAKKKAVREELLLRLGTSKDFILANLSKKLDLNEISGVAALSPYHFLRLFKAVYKKTPYQYLMEERMKRSVYLLKNSSKSINEISTESGYESHSSFSRNFKEYFGVTPILFRN
ncbi:helix-turn-helix domain-containing protein [Aquimarina sediminis]|uniref:helix-turn-helix domain-containing protein n=1 Tax=Aquimarina sediminis TaxID=2070536 RepID=UPI000CA0216E|nr:AraC family transcriptional regulator [Aquimarina sediminis]